MTAKNKFKKGDRVIQTQAWADWSSDPKFERQFGTVTGFSRDCKSVRVRIDGQRTVSGWNPKFWEIVKPVPDVASLDKQIKTKPLYVGDDACTITEEELKGSHCSVSQEPIASSKPSQAVDPAASIKTKLSPEFVVCILPVVLLENPERPEVKSSTSEQPSGAWQRVKNSIRGLLARFLRVLGNNGRGFFR